MWCATPDPGGDPDRLQMPAIFGGAIVTEQIFRIPASARC
jgi:hypothetical protein